LISLVFLSSFRFYEQLYQQRPPARIVDRRLTHFVQFERVRLCWMRGWARDDAAVRVNHTMCSTPLALPRGGECRGTGAGTQRSADGRCVALRPRPNKAVARIVRI
jgi:hypothetical protein